MQTKLYVNLLTTNQLTNIRTNWFGTKMMWNELISYNNTWWFYQGFILLLDKQNRSTETWQAQERIVSTLEHNRLAGPTEKWQGNKFDSTCILDQCIPRQVRHSFTLMVWLIYIYQLRGYKASITWRRSLWIILSLFWRHDIAKQQAQFLHYFTRTFSFFLFGELRSKVKSKCFCLSTT